MVERQSGNKLKFLQIRSHTILSLPRQSWTSVRFRRSAVPLEEEEFEIVSGLTFDHGEPAFEEFQEGVGGFVGDEVDPGIAGCLVGEGENVFCIAE